MEYQVNADVIGFWLRSIVQNGQVHPGTGEASHVPVMVVPGNVLCGA
ncbi:hypothetical protein EARG_05309 [Escherichia coli H461]|nr:hypothetical protein EARG_05309 [Escherichia coli H461]